MPGNWRCSREFPTSHQRAAIGGADTRKDSLFLREPDPCCLGNFPNSRADRKIWLWRDMRFVTVRFGVKEAVGMAALRASPPTWNITHECSATTHLTTSLRIRPYRIPLKGSPDRYQWQAAKRWKA